MEITSKSNEKVKYLKRLNEKKFRQQTKTFYIEGIKVLEEVLDSKKAVNILFIAYSKEILLKAKGGEELLQELLKEEFEFPILSLDKKLLEEVTDTKTPQGILAVLQMPNRTLDISSSTIVLDGIQDAGNMGTIIRTADAFAFKNIVCLPGCTDCYAPKVVRSTMASILRENIILEGETISSLKEKGYTIVGTSLQASQELSSLSYSSGKYAFVLGNEANGISSDVIEQCDLLVKIPMSGSAESLNVGIAAGILMYDYFQKNN